MEAEELRELAMTLEEFLDMPRRLALADALAEAVEAYVEAREAAHQKEAHVAYDAVRAALQAYREGQE